MSCEFCSTQTQSKEKNLFYNNFFSLALTLSMLMLRQTVYISVGSLVTYVMSVWIETRFANPRFDVFVLGVFLLRPALSNDLPLCGSSKKKREEKCFSRPF